MDLLTFIKKKKPEISKPSSSKPKVKPVIGKRYDTEINPLYSK